MKSNIPKELRYTSGLYEILNQCNGKVYIGSTINFTRRCNSHRRKLRLGIHPNPGLQNSVNKYGIDNFSFTVILPMQVQEGETINDFYVRLQSVENELILKRNVNRKKFGYNLRVTAESNRGMTIRQDALTRRKGRKLSEEVCKRMSEVRRGENGTKAKLTESKVKEIRAMMALGYCNAHLGRLHGLAKSSINSIERRITWVGVEPSEEEIKNIKIPSRDLRLIQLLLIKGITKPSISKIVGLSFAVINTVSKEVSEDEAVELEREFGKEFIDRTIDTQCEFKIKTDSRRRRGVFNNKTKLSEADVLSIKKKLLTDTPIITIANAFKINRYTVLSIESGKTWGYLKVSEVDAQITKVKRSRNMPKGEGHSNSKLTEANVIKIRQLLRNGVKQVEIQKMFGLSRYTTSRLKHGKIWTYV